MGNSNIYADGLQYLLFPGMYGPGYASYNFPESTAQDDGGGAGASSLSFSGSTIPYTSASNLGYGYGPSGFEAYYTPLVNLNPSGDTTFGGGFGDIMGLPPGNYDPTSTPIVSFYTTDPRAPNLNNIFLMDWDPTYEKAKDQAQKNLCAFNSISQVGVLDLLCEGPIEGFVTGSYTYSFSGKNVGDIGYAGASFESFATMQGNQPVGNPEARSIFWDDTPITDLQGYFNFQNVDYRFQYGEKINQHTVYNPYIYLYEDRRNYWGAEVDKNKIPLPTSTTKAINETLYGFYQVTDDVLIFTPKTYYIYNTEISSLKINFKINGLYEQIISGGNAGDVYRQNLIVRFTIYRILNNGELVLLDTSKYAPYEKAFWSTDDIRMAGKITDPMMFTYEIPLRPYAENKPSFPLIQNQIGWAVDVTKMSKEFTTSSLSNSLSLDSITEVYSDRFVYPDAALVYSKFDARFFSNIPTRTYKVRLLKVKVPINYDPITKTYNGPWNGKFKVAWTDNPAWCFYDLITNNRYGLGKYIDSNLADKWSLYEISQYCDQLVSDGVGGLEPRFRCNILITTKEEAYKVLNDMASIFQGIIYYSAGQIVSVQDSPKNPIYLFNNSNVIDGEFIYSDASKKSRRTVAIIRYNDENDNYKPAVEYVEDRASIFKFGIRETQIAAFGCTTKNQAKRLGKWLLTTQNTETEVVDFKVGLEGNYLKPGDIVSIYDQSRKNQIYAGRTLELKTGYAILDLPYNSTNTYAITGAVSSFTFNILTPTYNLNFGTKLGDLYATGFSDIGSSGTTGINSSFTRASQIQSVSFTNPKNYITSGSGIYSNNIRINFEKILLNSGYELPQNTVWTININTSGYISRGINTQSMINNNSQLYPGYYLESYLDKPKEYRILNIIENSPEVFSVNALEYNYNKFQDIDDIGTLANAPIRPNLPTTPTLILSGIFRNANGDFLRNTSIPSQGHYTTNQGGINSIMYNIIPPKSSSNTQYSVYVNSGFNFPSSSTPASTLKDIVDVSRIQTGIILQTEPIIPPFFTPLYSGIYYFRVFAENSIGEKSSPATGRYILSNQASVFTVAASGINVF